MNALSRLADIPSSPLAGLTLAALLLFACGDGDTQGSPGGDPADAQDTTPQTPDAQDTAETDPDLTSPDPLAVRLLHDGRSAHQIVLQPEASPSERHAAEELQAHFEACTGVRLPIVDAAETTEPTDETPLIVLGRGPLARRLGVDPSDAELGDQGFATRTVTPHLVIAGTPQAGTLYGVHRFLENALGVRWLAPGVTLTPRVSELTVPPTARIDRPTFFWRHTSYEWPGADADFWARATDNSGSAGPDGPWGVQYALRGSAHTYLDYVHPDEFFDEHPEYFSEIGGQRIREDTQLCLTNPDVLEIVTERVLAELAAHPETRQITFSQEDYYNGCQCHACRAMNERYGTQGGTQFWFVNQLAEATSARYPDVLIRTLAYMYTEEPPQDLVMHPNVAVWLCHMYPSCDSHPIQTCPENADYHRRALAWSALTDHLYVWHYVTNFTHYYAPFPNLRALASDLRFYRDIGVEGVFLQGMGHAGGGGELSLLRPYFGMKLLWDVDADPDDLIDEFLQGYYGDAWGPIRAYIDLLHDEVEQNDIHMHLYTNPAQGYLSDDVVASAEALFDEAEAAVADDPELLERVRVARMPLFYARFFPRNGYLLRDGKLQWQGERISLQELTDFINRMTAHGFETIREWEGGRDTLALLFAIVGQDHDLVTLENRQLRVDVVPMLGGRALRILDRSTGRSVTALNRTRSLYFPFAGGLEDRVGGLFRNFGWVEPAEIVERSARSVTLRSDTFNGYALQRRLTLDSTAPVLHVESTVTNPGDTPRRTQLRSHLALDLGELESARVHFSSRGGDPVDRDMAAVIAGLRQGQHFFREDTPDGAWTFTGDGGLEVTQRFGNADVDSTWLGAYPPELGELEVELWAPRTTLGPGESVTLRQEIEIRPIAE